MPIPPPSPPCVHPPWVAGLWPGVGEPASAAGAAQLLALQAEAQDLATAALAPSTARTYLRYQRYYVNFMVGAGLQAYLLDGLEPHLILYVAHLARTCKRSTIDDYLTGVRVFYAESGLENPLARANPQLDRVLKGILRVNGDTVVHKKGVEPWMLLRFKGILHSWGDLSVSSLHLAVFVAQLVGFFGFLRASNICVASLAVPPSDPWVLRRQDIEVDLHGYCLWLSVRRTKTRQLGAAALRIPLAGARGTPLDPVGIWMAYMARVPDLSRGAGQHAFAYFGPGGQLVPLTKEVFVAFLRRLSAEIGLSGADILSGHSFRRGGATYAFRAGVQRELIKKQGDWRSDAYLVYLELSEDLQLAASRSMHARLLSGTDLGAGAARAAEARAAL